MIDGKEVHFRFLTGEDKEFWMGFVDSCSARSLWLRFLAPFSATPERAERYCNLNSERELAVVAEIEGDGRRNFIAVGRLIRGGKQKEVEYAVIVSDPAAEGSGLHHVGTVH